MRVVRCLTTLNRTRRYAGSSLRTSFGSWAVVREWGRIGSPGTVREAWHATEDEAVRDGLALRRRKQRRGYKSFAVVVHLAVLSKPTARPLLGRRV